MAFDSVILIPLWHNDLGSGLSEGIGARLATMPTWVWWFIVLSIIWLMKPWEHIKGIPTWAWIAIVILAVWALITGK